MITTSFSYTNSKTEYFEKLAARGEKLSDNWVVSMLLSI